MSPPLPAQFAIPQPVRTHGQEQPHQGTMLGRFMRVAVLSSGGKDSAAAWWWAMCQGWSIEALVTVKVSGDDSPMFQIPGTHLVQQQAELASVPWVTVETTGETPNDIQDLERTLGELAIDGLVSGALRSDYQKSRLERMCERLGIRSWTPLWHQSGREHVKGMIEHGFKIMITSVSAEGLDDSWLGHILTETSFRALETLAIQHRFHIEGEGGEYETLVIAGPHFKGEVKVKTTPNWDGVRGHLTFH